MKYTDLSSIYKQLSVLSEPYPLLVIEGSDDFFLEDCVERYLDLWKRRTDGEVVRLSAAELLAKGDHLHGGRSLFGTKTLYIIDDISSLKGKKSAGLSPLLREIEGDLSFLFVDAEAVPQALLEEADQKGAVFILEAMKPWERQPFIVSWVQAFVKKRGKGIDKDASNVLAQAFAEDRGSLIQELEKLCMYRLNDPSITLKDVEQIGTIDLQPTMWQLLDGLLAGDAKAVTNCLVQSSDMHDIAVLRFVKNQLEKLLQIFEGGAQTRNRAQERQMAIVRKRGKQTLLSWINKMKMQEVAIRSGLEESEEGSLLPFFLSLCA